MFNVLKLFISIFVNIEIIFYYLDFSDINMTNYYLIIFVSVLYINLYLFDNKNQKLDLDLTFKFLLLVFKTPNFLLNYFINILKKIYTFLIHIKYKYLYYTLKILSKKYFSSIFILWRPLFKKTSYFGYYRSNRSKWIK